MPPRFKPRDKGSFARDVQALIRLRGGIVIDTELDSVEQKRALTLIDELVQCVLKMAERKSGTIPRVEPQAGE